MARLLGRLGGWCARHGRVVLAAWIILAAALTAGTLVFGRPVSNNVSIPGSDAQRAHDLMRDGFGPGYDTGGTFQVVLYAANGTLVSDERERAVDTAMTRIREVPHVVQVDTPYRMGGMSPSLAIGVLTVRLSGQEEGTLAETSRRISAAVQPVRATGVEAVVADNGTPADKEITTGSSEIIGLACALLVLLLAFGTLVAAMVPIFTAIVSLGVGLGVIGLLGHLVDVPKQASVMASMIGLGVGIDYALFLLSRHRKLLADGVPVHESVRRTTEGAGGAVFFAGGTVVIALSALLLAGFPLLRTLGWITGISVVCAVLTSLTLVPALLGLLGHRINALRLPFTGPRREGAHSGTTGWAALGTWVAGRPWRVLALAAAVLGALAAPALGLKLGPIDDGYADRGQDARRAYELMEAGFGPGSNGPLIVVGELDAKVAVSDPPAQIVTRIGDRLADVPGVAHVSPAKIDVSGRSVLFSVVTDYAPSDPRAFGVVGEVRGLDVPGVRLHVGGEVAGMTDASDRIAERTPTVIGVVVLLSALLLLLAFRAPIVAFKAALMNLVSLGAAFGALAIVFSYGLGSRLVGMDPPVSAGGSYLSTLFFTVPIDSYVPLMLFAVLFGLSMDYEVFLLTSVRQAFLRSGDNRRAVAEGLGATGRVITSAALIMVVVFVAFIAYPDPLVKVFGVGLAVAIAVDATIIRGLLVPATMVLLGRLNWWCPAWLDRILPDLSVAGHGEDDDPPSGQDQDRTLVTTSRS
ncbi:membrane protein [Sphaerisporangium melleum]|uniref:Membrane protein n=1 Tax=Sphaerisporangium melleum TaxID=321316 RepID=A0A917VIT7_9ACTN|nr:MMPL family transporter [Sphaerisporangium melleum]GGK83818.1 membrane protein [Sphaerisporangium melleum]GII69315.1 membrane protein [Sphaerisporangium melleum]